MLISHITLEADIPLDARSSRRGLKAAYTLLPGCIGTMGGESPCWDTAWETSGCCGSLRSPLPQLRVVERGELFYPVSLVMVTGWEELIAPQALST